MSKFEEFLGLVLRDELVTDLRQRAYMLATVKHECGGKWVPCEEKYNGDPVQYFTKKYDGRKELGNTQPGDGYLFRGRGYCQLTGRGNYERLSKRVGLDLVKYPEHLLDPDISYMILSRGMAEGLYAQGGRKLDKYIIPGAVSPNYVNARRIVNGTDQAIKIAGYAVEFESLLHSIRKAA